MGSRLHSGEHLDLGVCLERFDDDCRGHTGSVFGLETKRLVDPLCYLKQDLCNAVVYRTFSMNVFNFGRFHCYEG